MNAETQLFNPLDLDLSRSTFEGAPTHSGTMLAGRLIPLMSLSVMPGSEFTFQCDSLFKMSTPVYPTMDQLFADIFCFFVPNKLVLGRRYGTPNLNEANQSWAALVGAQDNLINTPIPESGVQLPKLTSTYEIMPSALLDYFAYDPYAVGTGLVDVNCLDLLSYFAIYNENFRDPNTMEPVTWTFDTTHNSLVPHGNVPLYATSKELALARSLDPDDLQDYNWVNALANDATSSSDASVEASAWLPFPVCRFHGYFGSMLPWPQRNTEGVELPLGDMAPVKTSSENFVKSGDKLPTMEGLGVAYGTDGKPYETDIVTYRNLAVKPVNNYGSVGLGSATLPASDLSSYGFVPSNLYADLSTATAANVNALRAAIQKQRWYEKIARSGNRYDELKYGTFGVRGHDSGDDRPRYLGGTRIALHMDMVASTNGGTDASSGEGSGSLGALGAFSHTNDSSLRCHCGFDEWGTVLFLACIRHHDMFGSGTDRRHLKRTRDDLYFPTFAHLGEQSTSDAELCRVPNGTVLGYNEAWQEERTWLDKVHGFLRPGKNLDYMTYARSFSSAPDLASFLNASTQVEDVDKTLAVGSNASGFQFVYQFTCNIRARLPLPTHSIPGLMDHF